LGALGLQANVTSDDQVTQAVRNAYAGLQGLDGLVNCAGVSVPATLEETDVAVWRRTLEVNLTGAFLVTRAAAPYLRKHGPATIVNVASALGLRPEPRHGAYVASKAALVAWTKVIAQELGPAVRANALCPGVTDTPMLRPVLAAGLTLEDLGRDRALKRSGTALEQAQAALFLTSHESSFVTGIALAVDGGRAYH
jgi:NAD(P)-dependent dehydrogenase (short-subunit alcohol dehydrogenase family)